MALVWLLIGAVMFGASLALCACVLATRATRRLDATDERAEERTMRREEVIQQANDVGELAGTGR